MPALADRELRRLIDLYLQAETDIINEIGRLRFLGLVDYHAEAALERVQKILRKLENNCWAYVPRVSKRSSMSTTPKPGNPWRSQKRQKNTCWAIRTPAPSPASRWMSSRCSPSVRWRN